MASILFPYGNVGQQQRTFKVSTSARINFGTPVELRAGGATVQLCDDWTDAIGHVLSDDAYEAQNGTTFVAVGDLVNVALKGPIINMVCGTTIDVGDDVTLDSNGQLTDIKGQMSGTTYNTEQFVGKALESGVLNGTIEVMRF